MLDREPAFESRRAVFFAPQGESDGPNALYREAMNGCAPHSAEVRLG